MNTILFKITAVFFYTVSIIGWVMNDTPACLLGVCGTLSLTLIYKIHRDDEGYKLEIDPGDKE